MAPDPGTRADYGKCEKRQLAPRVHCPRWKSAHLGTEGLPPCAAGAPPDGGGPDGGRGIVGGGPMNGGGRNAEACCAYSCCCIVSICCIICALVNPCCCCCPPPPPLPPPPLPLPPCIRYVLYQVLYSSYSRFLTVRRAARAATRTHKRKRFCGARSVACSLARYLTVEDLRLELSIACAPTTVFI